MCSKCKGKGHDTSSCPSKGGGKHVPKGQGKGQGQLIFYGKGSGGGKGFGKGFGKGKGKGKISDVDEAGWTHVGASAGGDWNWAAGPEWAAAEAVPEWPPAATWPPPVEAATSPWMFWQPSERGRRARPLKHRGLQPEEELQPLRRVYGVSLQ